MNVNGPQGQPTPAHYAALQQQQHQQSQHQHANPHQYGGAGNNHQLQQMYLAQQANKFAGAQHPGASMYPQQQQMMQQQQQGFNPSGVSPSALMNGRAGGMNMNMGMGNMGGMGGSTSGMSPQQMHQMQQMQQLQSLARVNPAMASAGGMGGINPSQLLNQHHLGMNGGGGTFACCRSSSHLRQLNPNRYGWKYGRRRNEWRNGKYEWNEYEWWQYGWNQPCCIDCFKYRRRYVFLLHDPAFFFALHTGFEISKLIELERRTDSSIESSLFSPPYPLVVYLVHSYIQFLFDKRAASKRCFTLTIEVPLFIFFYHSFDVTSLHFSSSSK